MRVLVTGATGFLGRHLVTRLRADGRDVRALARSAKSAASFLESGAEVVIGDIADQSVLRTALQGVDVVYHLAGRLLRPGGPLPASEYHRINVEGTRALLAGCAEQRGVRRLVHASTTGVLGFTGPHPAGEDAPIAPTNVYEQTKWHAEQLVREVIGRGFPAVIARPALVYGPGDFHLLGFFKAIQRGTFRPIGSAPVWTQPIYVDDLTEAFIRLAEDRRAVGECFHLAGEQPVTLVTLASTISRALGRELPGGTIPMLVARAMASAGDLLPARLRPLAPLTSSRLDYLTRNRVYHVAKARRLLGFVAGTSLATGIGETVAWYRQQGHLPADRSGIRVPVS